MADPLAAARSTLDAQVDTLARTMCESPEAVRKAIEGAVPAAMASLIGRGETEDGVIELRTALQDAQTGPELLTKLGTRLDGVRLRGRAGGAGTRLLGGRGQALTEQLAPWAGLKPASAGALVDLTVPVVLASLRRSGGPAPADAEAVRDLLRRQATAVNRDLPAELRPRFEIVLQPEPAAAAAPAFGGSRYLWIVLIVLALIVIAVLWWVFAGQAHAATLAGSTSGEPAAWALALGAAPPAFVSGAE